MLHWIDAVRRNHGLEHATVTVLLARRGPLRIVGRASADGFFVIGDVDEAQLLACAHEALERMQHGEAELAISPFCGTNIAVTGALTAAAAMVANSRSRGARLLDRFGNAFTAATFAVVAAQPLGRLVQRHLTTRADLDGVEIVGVRTLFPGVHRIDTRATT